MNLKLHPVAIQLAKVQLKGAVRHFLIFVICLVLGVSVLTTVNLLAKLTQTTLINESKSLLGGDLEITSRGTIDESVVGFLKQYGQTSYITTTQGMLITKDEKRLLVSIKAIDENYPLYGEFILKSGKNPNQVLNENRLVADSALLAQLGLKLNEPIQLGSGRFMISDEIFQEPDRVVQTLNFGPRVMMSRAALEKSGLVSNLSLKRDRIRLKLNPNLNALEFKEQLQSQLDENFSALSLRVRDETDDNDGIKEFIDKLSGFLNLLSLGIFLIAGIGIASSTRAYLSKTYQTVAILKVQGANQSIILQTYGILIGILALISAVIGVILAYLIFYAALPTLTNIMPIIKDKVTIDFISPLLALWYSLLIAFLFSIPSLMSLHQMKAAVFFRQKVYSFNAPVDRNSLMWIGALGLILILSITFNSSNPIFMIVSIAVMILALLLFVALAYLAQKIASKIKGKSLWQRLALANIAENKSNIYVVILAIGMSLSVLLTLNLTEANFNRQIEQRSQTQIPDLFMIDIQPTQIEKLSELLKTKPINEVNLLPLVRGRISHIKGVRVEEINIPEEIDWAISRDRGISYSDLPPKNARISHGQWWSQNYQGKALASLDERMRTEMGLKVGDEITIEILNESFNVEIASFRRVDYASFQINFFLMLSPNAIQKFPHSFISTIYLKHSGNDNQDLNQRADVVRSINQAFPNISIVQTKEVIDLIQRMVDNIAIALKLMASLSIIAGFLIYPACFQPTFKTVFMKLPSSKL